MSRGRAPVVPRVPAVTDAAPTRPAPPSPRGLVLLWTTFLIAGGALYSATATRGALWQDSGWQQYRITAGTIDHPRGLALTHPLQYHLGRLAIAATPLRPADAITLVSVVAGGLAVANVAVVAALLSGSLSGAALTTLALLLAHTFWKFSATTESYALVACLLAGQFVFVMLAGGGRPAWLYGAALCNGLGVSNHLLAGLTTPVLLALGAWLVATKRWSAAGLAVCGGLWLLGAAPYGWIVVQEGMTHGDWLATLRSATVGTFAEAVLNTGLSGRLALFTAGYVLYNFPGLTVPLAMFARPGGAAVAWPYVWALIAGAAIHFFFAARYPIVDQFTFFVPFYVLLTPLAALGLARLRARLSRRAATTLLLATFVTAAWTPAVYALTAQQLRERGWFQGMVRNKPYRDGYRSFFLPWGIGDDHGDRLNAAVRAAAGENGLLLIEDHMQGFGIRYGMAAGELPGGLRLVEVALEASSERLAEVDGEARAVLAGGGRVVLIPQDRDRVRFEIPAGSWRRAGDIYVLEAAAGGGAP